MSQVQKDYTYRVCYVNNEDPDNLLEWYTTAPNSRESILNFLYIHENPELTIVSNEPVFTYSGPVAERIPVRLLFASPAVERINFTASDKLLPEFLQVQDEFLVRAVYGVCHLWIQENGEEIFRAMANSLHLIGAHSMRYALEGEPLSPTADNESYSFLRDAAFLLDYIATGDNPVFRSKELMDAVNTVFPDLIEN